MSGLVSAVFSSPKTPDLPPPPKAPKKEDAAAMALKRRQRLIGSKQFSLESMTATPGGLRGVTASAAPYIGKKQLTGQ